MNLRLYATKLFGRRGAVLFSLQLNVAVYTPAGLSPGNWPTTTNGWQPKWVSETTWALYRRRDKSLLLVEEESRSLGLLDHNTNWAMPVQCSRYLFTMAKRHKFCMEKLWNSRNVINNLASAIVNTTDGSSFVNCYSASTGKYLKMFNTIIVPPSVGPD